MRIGLGLGLGVGGAPLAPPPFDPTIYAGNTLRLRADTGITLVSSEVRAWTDGTRTFGPNDVAGYPTMGTMASGKPAVVFASVSSQYLGASSGVGSVTVSDLISATEFTCFAVCNIVGSATNTATHYNNPAVIAADSGGCSCALFRSNDTTGVGNFDANSDQANAAFTFGVDALVTCWHRAGSIYVQVNGGTPVSVASGNTFALTGPFYLAKSQTFYLNGKVAEIDMYNVALADADRDAANATLMAYYGIA